jgi:hypothetical protein
MICILGEHNMLRAHGECARVHRPAKAARRRGRVAAQATPLKHATVQQTVRALTCPWAPPSTPRSSAPRACRSPPPQRSAPRSFRRTPAPAACTRRPTLFASRARGRSALSRARRRRGRAARPQKSPRSCRLQRVYMRLIICAISAASSGRQQATRACRRRGGAVRPRRSPRSCHVHS